MARDVPPERVYKANTPVKYWGKAKRGAYYGLQGVILWVNQCGCAHQTYAVQFPDGTKLEQVLHTSLTVVEG